VDVFKSINALQGRSDDRAFEGQMRARVAGKVITLDNMASSSYYERNRSLNKTASTMELTSARVAKRAGLYDHSEKVAYSEFDDLASMWRMYSASCLRTLDAMRGEDAPAGVPLAEYKHTILCRNLEFTGAFVTVTDSVNQQLVGVAGRVMRDQKHVFQVISVNNKIRLIPKEVCTFSIAFPGDRSLTFRGSDLIQKPKSR